MSDTAAVLPGRLVVMGIIRDVVTVTGSDARGYLHSQVSQDVESMAPRESRWTLVLSPNGRVDALARILCVDDETFELDTDPGFGQTLLERLDRFRIRVKAELDVATTDVPVESRIGWWNTDSWSDDEAARIAAGWPAMGTEIVPGERIPAEVAVAPVAVNFTKGCYPGQELVERMDSRGSEAPRQLRILSPDEAAATGAEVTSAAGGRVLGYVKRGVDAGRAPGPSSA